MLIDRLKLDEIISLNKDFVIKLKVRDFDNKNNDKITYYIFENSYDIIVSNPNEENIILYEEDEDFINSLGNNNINNLIGPFFKDRRVVDKLNEGKTKEILIYNMFNELGINKPSKLIDVDLDLLNNRLKEYGYKKVQDKRFYLPLILFCGEYIKYMDKGGTWLISRKHSNPFEFFPVFVDKKGQEYDFLINGTLMKWLRFANEGKDDDGNEFKFFDIKEIFVLINAFNKMGLDKAKVRVGDPH